MSWFYKPYVSAAERRRKAEKKIAAMRKKGETIEPVTLATPRGKIATSFWGKAWCDHLESFSDYENRLPRGRTYLRNGSVLHLAIGTGHVRALVMGSALYEQTIHMNPLPKTRWDAVKTRCQGKIGSLIELLQGRISDDVMAVVTDREHGLFPGPREIRMECSCPDWAGLCKHLAAILYGVGARLDTAPELLFKLRGVDHNDLIQTDAAALVAQGATDGKSRRRLAPAALGDVFGIEIEEDNTAAPPPRKTRVAREVSTAEKSAPEKSKPSARIPPIKNAKPPRKNAAKQARRTPGSS